MLKYFIAASLQFTSMTLLAQWSPYTGIHTAEVRYADATGKVVRQDISTSTEYRTSKGFFRRDSSVGDRSYIWNPETSEAVYLVHSPKSARVEKQGAASPAEYGPRGTPLREDIVGNHSCSVFPVLNEARQPIGEVCFSVAHKVSLRREIRTPMASGGILTRVETRVVRFEEPIGVSFALPADYQNAGASCAACARR